MSDKPDRIEPAVGGKGAPGALSDIPMVAPTADPAPAEDAPVLVDESSAKGAVGEDAGAIAAAVPDTGEAPDAPAGVEDAAGQDATATQDEAVTLENSLAANMEELAAAVLDSAEVANQSAHVAGRAAHNLLDASDKLRAAGAKGQKFSLYVMGGASAMLVIALIVFIAMANAMSNRLQRVDNMLLAVATRVVEMNTGLNMLDNIQGSIADFYNVQASFRDAQIQLERRIEAVAAASEAMAAQVPGRTAEEVGLLNNELALRLTVLEKAVADQRTAYAALEGNMQAFSNSVGGLERRLGNVDRLNRDVAALVTLQRERYLEAVEAERAVRERPREDTFVIYQRAVPEAAGATAGEGAGATPGAR